jgi:hypothetical protein
MGPRNKSPRPDPKGGGGFVLGIPSGSGVLGGFGGSASEMSDSLQKAMAIIGKLGSVPEKVST